VKGIVVSGPNLLGESKFHSLMIIAEAEHQGSAWQSAQVPGVVSWLRVLWLVRV
jgi:hypothetical protein